MRAQLCPLARWLKLAFACLAVGAAVSPAQVASAVEPVAVVQGGSGKKPIAVVAVRAQAPAGRGAVIAESPLAFAAGVVRTTAPRASRLALFLLHRALLR